MKYRQANGSESRLVFGRYPEVSLLEARNKRTEARALLAKKIDPAQVRRDEKAETASANANTFEKIAREWHTNRLSSWSASTAKDTINRLEKDIFPAIGKLPIASITRKVISVQASVASSIAMC